MKAIELLYRQYLQPSEALLADIQQLDGDIMILGAGGKMGPALARLAKQAIDVCGINKKVMAASRFSEPGLQDELESLGIKTYAVDLLDDEALRELPYVKNVLYLAGQKFGTTGREAFTWAMNAYLPGRVAEHYKNSRIVAFSTGNVYPLSDVQKGGLTEKDATGPIGEYAQSCLGRERIFQYASSKYNMPVFIYRLNYANDVTYGVLLEIAKSVYEGKPIDIAMGYVNVIWQGDANEIAIRALHHCSSPATIVNVTGHETLSVKWIALQFGKLFGKTPQFINQEQPTALLSNASECVRLFGEPRVTVQQMIELLAEWLRQGGKTIDKPTHFQEREGQF